MIFLFVRHGETESNKRKIYAGWSMEALTLRGRWQVLKVAEQLLDCNIVSIYCSPLKRTIQTAEIIGSLLKIQPIISDSFKEMRLGIWEGKSEKQIRTCYPEEWCIWNTMPTKLVLNGRETLHELLERVLKGVEKIKAGHTKGNALVVTHVGIIRILMLHSDGLDLDLYRTISVENGKVFAIKNL